QPGTWPYRQYRHCADRLKDARAGPQQPLPGRKWRRDFRSPFPVLPALAGPSPRLYPVAHSQTAQSVNLALRGKTFTRGAGVSGETNEVHSSQSGAGVLEAQAEAFSEITRSLTQAVETAREQAADIVRRAQEHA